MDTPVTLTSRCNISYETFTMAAIYLTGSKTTKSWLNWKKGSQCCQQFSKEAVLSNLNNCLELSHGELDLVVLANIQACTKIKITGEKRKRSSRCSFLYINRPICKDMFLHTLRHQLLTVSQIKRTPWRTWCCSKSSWKLQKATTQRLTPSLERGRQKFFNKLRGRKCCFTTWPNPWL